MAEATALCLKLRIPFVLYRLPGENCIFFSNPGISNKSIRGIDFRISMWNEPYCDSVVIKDELDETETLSELKTHKPDKEENTLIFPWPISTKRLQYEGQLRKVISNLKKRGGKTVISRVVAKPWSHYPEKWVETANDVFNSYPDAMCCLYYTPTTGAWLCASPELLLDADIKGRTLHTIALAGTRKIQTGNSAEWPDKDVEEHNIVKAYIADSLESLGSKVTISKTETCRAGKVEHLLTKISANMPEGLTVEKFLDTVNPTPAICGYPTDTALNEINDTEVHSRYCYGGYISVETQSRVTAFVNLRCVHFNEERMALYAGSGVMPESTPEGEWEETGAKLSTIGDKIMRKQTEA